MNAKKLISCCWVGLALMLVLGACATPQTPPPILTVTPPLRTKRPHTATFTLLPTRRPSRTPAPTSDATLTLSPTITQTPTFDPNQTPTQTRTPRPIATSTLFTPGDAFTTCDEIEGIPVSECEALWALNEAIHGGEPSHWFQSNKPCLWGTVYCEDGHVYDLEIYTNGINPLPLEIGNFPNLYRLSIVGPIHEVPPQIGKLESLEVLSIYNGKFTSLPIEITNLKNLWMLIIVNGELSGCIPPVLGKLESLKTLALYNNHFECSIPSELGNLVNLTSLELRGNQLTGPIPPELGNLEKLAHLDLIDNQLSGPIPPEIGNMTNLFNLYLANNQLEGEIPATFVNLQRIDALYLDGNRLYSTNPEVIAFLDEKAPGWAEKQDVVGEE